MENPESLARSRASAAKFRLAPALIVFGLLVLASKIMLIALFGNATPLWDQWDAEGHRFYSLLLRDSLPWLSLLDGYNEHHIVMTRLLDMALLALNGKVWNPLLQMAANALIHVSALLMLMNFLCRTCSPPQRLPLLTFATLLFCMPLGYENTLWGFQSQIYFVLLFSIVFLWCLSTATPFSTRWWLGMLCGVLAFLSFGTGTVALITGLALLLFRRWRGMDTSAAHGRAMVMLAILAVFAVLLTPPSSSQLSFLAIASPWELAKYQLGFSKGPAIPVLFENPRAESLAEFVQALYSTLSWPTFLFAPLVYFPLLRFMWRFVRQPEEDRGKWFVFTLGLWMLAQIVLFSYGRAKSPLVSRYTDFYAIGVLLNFYCLLPDLQRQGKNQDQASGRWARLPVIWLFTLLLALGIQLAMQMDYVATIMAPAIRAEERHIVDYLKTEDTRYLDYNDFATLLPSPSPKYLWHSLNDPAVRYILPPNLVPRNAERQPAWINLLTANLRPLGELILTLALALALWLWIGPSGPRTVPPDVES